jgi:hypothetical protein
MMKRIQIAQRVSLLGQQSKYLSGRPLDLTRMRSVDTSSKNLTDYEKLALLEKELVGLLDQGKLLGLTDVQVGRMIKDHTNLISPNDRSFRELLLMLCALCGITAAFKLTFWIVRLDDDKPDLKDMDKWVQEHGFSWPSNHRWWEDGKVNVMVNEQLGDTIRRNIGKDIVLGNITDPGLNRLRGIPILHVAIPDDVHREQLTRRKAYEPDLRDWEWIKSRKEELSRRYPTYDSFDKIDLSKGPKFIIATPGTGKSHLIRDWDSESRRRKGMNGPADNNVESKITWESNELWLKGKSVDELKKAVESGEAIVLRNRASKDGTVESERDAFDRVSVDHPGKYMVPETSVGLKGNESPSDMKEKNQSTSETKDEQPSKSILKKTSFRK